MSELSNVGAIRGKVLVFRSEGRDDGAMGLKQKIFGLIRKAQAHIDQPKFPFYLALLAFLDVFLVFIPTDGIVVSSAMARPRRWFAIFAGITIGSVAGVTFLGAIIYWDAELIKGLAPWIFESDAWAWAKQMIHDYGFWAVFLGGLGFVPPTQPFIVVPILAEMHFGLWFLAFSTARLLKFLSFAWIASHSPKIVSRFKIFQLELDELQRQPDKTK